MGIAALDHVNIATAKLQETREFFIGVLGLEEGSRPEFDFPGHWLYAGGKDVVHLVGVVASRGPSSDAALDHFALRIDDYEDAVARLDKAGLTYRAVGVPGRATRQIFVRDPNGVTIELNCPGS